MSEQLDPSSNIAALSFTTLVLLPTISTLVTLRRTASPGTSGDARNVSARLLPSCLGGAPATAGVLEDSGLVEVNVEDGDIEPTSLVRVLMLPVGEKSSGDTPLPLPWPLGALILVPEALLCLGEGLEA